MKTVRAVAVTGFFAVCVLAISLVAADATGKWVGEVKLANGQALPFVAHLKQDGTKITGKLDGINGAPDVEIMNGKIDKDTITFNGVRQINSAEVKFNYTGTVDKDTIAFKILRDDGQGAPLESLTKRAKD